MVSAYFSALVVAAVALARVEAQNKPTFSFNNQPHTWEQGQTGYNNCGTTDSATAKCQTIVANSVEDFCLWGSVKANAGVGDVEHDVVAYCVQSGHGARLIPKGAISGAHFVETPSYITLTGRADLSKININGNKNGGGELDPHGADGNGNPAGGLVFSTAGSTSGQPLQMKEWQMFLENDRFCLKACKQSDKNAKKDCPHVYDEQGCFFNNPGNYAKSFDTCKGDNVLPPGVYGTSTWYQGVNPTPNAHPAAKTSACTKLSTITYGSYGTKIATSVKPPKSTATGNTAIAKPSTKPTSSKHTSSKHHKSTKSKKASAPTKSTEPKKSKQVKKSHKVEPKSHKSHESAKKEAHKTDKSHKTKKVVN